ncbi:hypothetical protein FB45DRAFT_464620 [Roridomyces roridus]|uniref:OTU domain-containing protein n=1 Tax=Roridomyces roridus TaxID=1738132 RepID=A0AAD7F6U5_9AGAR|nr:hypothetical protein FB45DRAFT_464620 [Roridomyces roridus]
MPKKIQSQLRPRTTRSSKARLLSDPMQNTALLTEQLRSLGLYAAPTLGDGNCLFRALSDQLYGTPTRHAQLRKDICDWIASHQARYEPFVEDERGLDAHLRCMRENATYGGHMELSAFAHLTRRNVKVIQPGLVYVIEWASGGPSSPVLPAHPSPTSGLSASSHSGSSSSLSSLSSLGSQPGPSRARRSKDKDKDNMDGVEVIDVEEDGGAGGDGDGDLPLLTEEGTVYVAYHDWEHFSSIRNLRGPHSGLPSVRETPAPSASYPPSPTLEGHSSAKLSKKADAQERKRLEREAKDRAKRERREAAAAARQQADKTPKVPMPKVRLKLSSASPTKDSQDALPEVPLASRLRSADRAAATAAGAGVQGGRVQRSPKRSFDESSGGGGDGTGSESERESMAKRTRRAYRLTGRSHLQDEVEEDEDEDGDGDAAGDEDEEGDEDVSMDSEDDEDEEDAEGMEDRTSSGTSLSLASSLSPPALSSSSSLSSLSSVSPSPPPPEVVSISMTAKPLTRRQRKALGLPKTRAAAATAGKSGGAGKIVIPGGRYEGTGEWRRNGTGRVDVRGFRELKI